MISLEIRRTRTYVGTYQHLDKWEEIGTFDEIGRRELPRKDEEDAYDPCEPKTYEVFCLVKTGFDLHARWLESDERKEADATFDKWRDAQIRDALRDTHTQSGCACEHDCCGCRSFNATKAERVTGDLWRVVIHSSRNF